MSSSTQTGFLLAAALAGGSLLVGSLSACAVRRGGMGAYKSCWPLVKMSCVVFLYGAAMAALLGTLWLSGAIH